MAKRIVKVARALEEPMSYAPSRNNQNIPLIPGTIIRVDSRPVKYLLVYDSVKPDNEPNKILLYRCSTEGVVSNFQCIEQYESYVRSQLSHVYYKIHRSIYLP